MSRSKLYPVSIDSVFAGFTVLQNTKIACTMSSIYEPIIPVKCYRCKTICCKTVCRYKAVWLYRIFLDILVFSSKIKLWFHSYTLSFKYRNYKSQGFKSSDRGGQEFSKLPLINTILAKSFAKKLFDWRRTSMWRNSI